ncbi:MAG: mechanosensitive ion channel [Ignavibacteriales bacterium]|nr:MAG: mechanosensitive ion channel [Ignavibacteriales bacterium]
MLTSLSDVNAQPDSTKQQQTSDTVRVVDTVFIHSTQDTSGKNIVGDLDLSPPSIDEIVSFEKILWAVIFFFAGLYLIKLITKLLDIFAERSTGHRITIKGFIPVIRILSWAFVLYLIIHGIFKPPAETILAILASLGIAVGFASQDIFKNIFGGIMIIFDRPFQVGDKIEIDGHYGEVIKIGLRSTRIVTSDDSVVTIPNGDLMNKSVSNSNSGEPNCQVVAEIFLPISIDTTVVRQIALEAAQVSKYIYLNKPITVLFFNEMNEQKPYYKMRVKAYVMDIRYEFSFKSDMTEIVLRELIRNKIIAPE